MTAEREPFDLEAVEADLHRLVGPYSASTADLAAACRELRAARERIATLEEALQAITVNADGQSVMEWYTWAQRTAERALLADGSEAAGERGEGA